MRLMKDGLISIWVDVNFKYRFHQLVAPEIQVEFVFKHMFLKQLKTMESCCSLSWIAYGIKALGGQTRNKLTFRTATDMLALWNIGVDGN